MSSRALLPFAALFSSLAAAGLVAGSLQESGAKTYKGLSITVTGVERATNVSLQDCPPGANIVRGVIRPGEEMEFASVEIDVKVLPSFEPGPLQKPVLYGEADTAYKTAQSFYEAGAEPSYACRFSFRVPKGAPLTRFEIGEASFDLRSLAK